MAKFNITTFYKTDPILAVASLVGLIYVGRKIYTNFMSPVTPYIAPVPTYPGQSITKTTAKGKTTTTGAKYTYGAQQYKDFADNLFTAMEYSGTDEKAIQSIMLKMKTYDDVLALIDAYGTRSLHTFAFPEDYTLAQALYSELNATELKTYVNIPLKQTGYQF
jgi:hypothetical protein